MGNKAVLKNISDEDAKKISIIFKALGESSRVAILHTLAQRELCVMDLAEHIGRSESAVSHQLRYLRAAGLVDDRKEGRNIFYSLKDKRISKLFRLALDNK